MAQLETSEHWEELYRRALFEEDRDKLPDLLERAHRAVQNRVRELWYSRAKPSERERRELHAADYYLGLLRSLENRRALIREDY